MTWPNYHDQSQEGPPDGRILNLILLPTLFCDAACDYCFEVKNGSTLDHNQLQIIATRVFQYMKDSGFNEIIIHWQGGEVMTLGHEWFRTSGERIGALADTENLRVGHGLQTNLLAYHPGWDELIQGMFGGHVGTSFDYPNLFRKTKNGDRTLYNEIWTRNFRNIRDKGFSVGVISVPNQATLEVGPQSYYEYFVNELGLKSFQINTPFPGGELNPAKESFIRFKDGLVDFYLGLAELWLKDGIQEGVNIGPFDQIFHSLHSTSSCLPCIFRPSCTHDFFCVGPSGLVAQCDCWVASYPEYSFGNIFDQPDLKDALANSEARNRLLTRPGRIVTNTDCLECDYLSFCHGGCPIRAFTFNGDLFTKDPYCDLYRQVFKFLDDHQVIDSRFGEPIYF